MKIYIFFLIFVSFSVFSQTMNKEDITLPNESMGSSGAFGSYVNEATGKVKTSLSISSIASRSLVYPIDISYDGENVNKQATYKTRYMASGILGIGWSMNFPKIVADFKGTATRDDDVFYLNGTEILCVKRPDPSTLMSGVKIWEFKLKSPLQYVIKYYDVSVDYDMTDFYVTKLDYWEVIDDQGRTYIYGNSDNTKENVLAWGNWIGDSKAAGAEKHTAVWNLSTLKDQYNNNLSFTYLKVENGFSAVSLKHTEACYIQQIISSTGEKIVFSYGSKTGNEYYEPHTEAAEPDAYQERYEKNYLTNVRTYNATSSLVSNHEFSYTIVNQLVLESAKRYLTKVTNKNAADNSLPSHTFTYYATGAYTGHLKSRSNPNGGSLTYNYQENTLWTNSVANTVTNNIFPGPNDSPFGNYHSDNYKLSIHGDVPDPSGSTTFYSSFYIIRDTWNGRQWYREKFEIPEQIRVRYEWHGYYYLDNAKFVFGNDYYAILIYDRNSDFGTLHTFHLKPDGKWFYSGWSSVHTGGNNDNDYSEDPVLLSGDDFIAIGTNKIGKIMIYWWNDQSWDREIITQGAGNYYYGAKNNFILAVNTVSGVDMPTIDVQDPFSYYDRYYIHYRDGERKWQTKSWTNYMTSTVGNISAPSSFYPSNALATLVAGSNPEYFLRWDTKYNITSLQSTDGVNDIYPFFPLVNNIFAGVRIGDTSRPKIFRLSAFDGQNWYTINTNHETISGFGYNKASGLAIDYNSHSLFSFNPNTAAWTEAQLPYTSPPNFNYNNMDSFAFANDLFISGDRLYRQDNNSYVQVGSFPYFYYQQYAKGAGEYIYVHHHRDTDTNDYNQNGITAELIGEKKYYYIDKTTNNLMGVVLETTTSDNVLNLYSNGANRRAEQFGGKYPFFSKSNLQGRKLIDNKFNNVIKDIVPYEVVENNGEGVIRRIQYTFEDSNTLMDDKTIIYGKVTIRDVGYLNGANNGYTVKTFDKGTDDASRAGFQLKEDQFNYLNVIVSRVTFTPTRYSLVIKNSEGIILGVSYNWRPSAKQELLHKGGGTQILVTNTAYTYDGFGRVITTSYNTSEGLTKKMSYEYADGMFPFVAAKNFKALVAKLTTSVNNEVIAIEKTNWVQNGNTVNVSQNLSGTAEANLRLNNDITSIDSYGNILETSNGKGISKSVLMGYNHKYIVATVNNIKFDELVTGLDVSYATLQTYTAIQLKTELLKLYTAFPTALISIDLYDNYGRVITSIDARKNEVNYKYDEFGRITYVTDKSGNVLSAKQYNYGN